MIVAIVKVALDLLRRVVSISYAYRDGLDREREVLEIGANTIRLKLSDTHWDR